MKALDIEAVQAFVLTADMKSFTRAAEAMDTTQSAVSLKIKRLEDGLGRRLLERTPRLVRLSADGSAFLGPARTLVAAHHGAVDSFGLERRRLGVGISHHIVGAELPLLLKRLPGAHLGVQCPAGVVVAFIDGPGLSVPVEQIHLSGGHGAGGELDRSLHALAQHVLEGVGVLFRDHFRSSSIPGCWPTSGVLACGFLLGSAARGT